MSYRQLLRFGRSNLRKFLNSSLEYEDNITGIEESILEGSYMKQIIKLNKYIYTTASTNYPNDIYFQPMCVSGYMLKTQAKKLKILLEESEISYNFVFYQPHGYRSHSYQPHGVKLTLLQYNLKSKFPEILDEFGGIITEDNIEHIENKITDLKFYSTNKEIIRKASIISRLLRETELHGLINYDYFNEIPEKFESLTYDLVEFTIVDEYRPTSRNLYTDLTDMLENIH